MISKYRQPRDISQFDDREEIDPDAQFMEDYFLLKKKQMLRREMVRYNAMLALGRLAAHCAAAFMMIATVEIIQRIVDRLSGTNDGFVFFRRSEFAFSVKWLFNAADVGILITFCVAGCLVFFRTYNKAL